jgi:hypothetical protein
VTWTKLDDGIFDHPRMLVAGEDAANLHVRALVWCNRHLTDGRLPAEALAVLTRKRTAEESASALVRVGAWETHPEGGWTVRGFHEHNPTAEEVKARRAALQEKRSEAGRLGGIRSGETRGAKQRSKAQATHEAKASNDGKQSASTLEARVEAPSRPVPEGKEEEAAPTAPTAPAAPALRDNPLEVLARASGGRVGPFAAAADQVALATALADLGIVGAELEAFGRALAGDGAARLWPRSEPAKGRRSLTVGFFLGRDCRARMLVDGVTRWRESAAVSAEPRRAALANAPVSREESEAALAAARARRAAERAAER